jgi:hypothetical protein
MQAIKDEGLKFHDLVSGLGNSREIALAKTKIEEAVMWAVKHITACRARHRDHYPAGQVAPMGAELRLVVEPKAGGRDRRTIERHGDHRRALKERSRWLAVPHSETSAGICAGIRCRCGAFLSALIPSRSKHSVDGIFSKT